MDMYHYNEMNNSKVDRNGCSVYPGYPPHHSQVPRHSINPKDAHLPLQNAQQPYIRTHSNSINSNLESCSPLMNNCASQMNSHHMRGLNHDTTKMQRGGYSNCQENYPMGGGYNDSENIPFSEQAEKRQSSKQNTSQNLSAQKSNRKRKQLTEFSNHSFLIISTEIQSSATKSKIQNGKSSKFGAQRTNESTKQSDQENSKNTPPEEQNFNYYHEFCRLYTANVVLTNQLKELVGQKTDLNQKLTKLEKKSEEIGEQDGDDKKKRFRRIASQIDRHYKCPNTSCQKSYGSEGSLNQHLKIKHPELYQGGPTNSIADSERNSYYDGNMESFQQFMNEDGENSDEQNESEQECKNKVTKKQKQN